MSAAQPLDDIKTRIEGHTEGPWRVWKGDGGRRSAVVETAWARDGEEPEQITDYCATADAELIAAAPKLLAALEAVETLLAEKYKLYAAICGETCVKDIVGVDHEAIADNIVANIRATIAEALA